MDFFSIFSYSFLQNALIAGALVGVVCPVIGVFVLMKQYSMIADTLGHVSLTGVALWLLTGIPPIITTAIYSLVSAVGIDRLRSWKNIPSDATLSIFLSGNLALAILLLNFTNSFGVNLHSYLFGSILTVQGSDIWILAWIVAIVFACLLRWYREILVTCMDNDHATIQWVNVRWMNTGLIILISLTVTASLLVVGILLVGALLILPVLSASQIAKNLRQTTYFSIAISLFSVLTGIILSFLLNIPASSAITLLLVAILGVLKVSARYSKNS